MLSADIGLMRLINADVRFVNGVRVKETVEGVVDIHCMYEKNENEGKL